MAVYQFNFDRKKQPDTLGLRAFQFVQNAFTYRGNDLAILQGDYTSTVRTKKAMFPRSHEETMIQTVEIEYLINRVRIRGEIQGKQGMGLEGRPVLKIIQKQEMDMLGVPPSQPRVLKTEWVCEVNKKVDSDLRYTKRTQDAPLEPVMLEATKSSRWNRFKTWFKSSSAPIVETVAIVPVSIPTSVPPQTPPPPPTTFATPSPPPPVILFSRVEGATVKPQIPTAYKVNVDYLYEDNDINAIFAARLQDKALPNVYRVSATTSDVMASGKPEFVGAIEAELLRQKGKEGILLVPYNQGGDHWVGLMLPFDKNGKIQEMNYINSLNSAHELNKIAMHLENAGCLASECPCNNLNLLKQNDFSTCGAYTIENLLYAARGVTTLSQIIIGEQLNNEQIRSLHLQSLQTHNPKFYASEQQPNGGFYERQRLNKPTVSNVQETLQQHDISLNKTETKQAAALLKAIQAFSPEIQTLLKSTFFYDREVFGEEVKLYRANLVAVVDGLPSQDENVSSLKKQLYTEKNNLLDNKILEAVGQALQDSGKVNRERPSKP